MVNGVYCSILFLLVLLELVFFPRFSYSTDSRDQVTSESEISEVPPVEVQSTSITPFFSRSQEWPKWDGNLTRPKSLQNLEQVLSIATEGSPRLSMRGSQSASRVLALYDGIPVNLDDGFGPVFNLIATEISDSVELFQGPMSVHHGSHALGGAMQFHPREFKRPLVQIEQGSLDQTSGLLVIPWAKNQISLFREDRKGTFNYTDASGENKTRAQQPATLNRATFRSQQNFQDLSLYENAIYSEENKIFPGSVQMPYRIEMMTNSFLGALSGISHLQDNLDLRAQLSYLQNRVATLDEQNNPYGSTAQQWHSTLGLQTTLGSQIQLEIFSDFSTDLFHPKQPVDQEFTSQHFEPGVTVDLPVTEEWLLQTGVRFISEYQQWVSSSAFQNKNSERTYWLSLQQGFRRPAMSDLWQQYAYFKGNPDLKPESSNQGEFGVQFNLNRDAASATTNPKHLRLVLFYTQYDNLITIEPISPILMTKTNHHSAYSYGAETSLGIPIDAWSLTGSLRVMGTRDVTRNSAIPFSPEQQIAINLSRRYRLFEIAMNNTYWGTFYDIDFNAANALRPMRPWLTTDLLANFDLSDAWSFKVTVKNVFDIPRELTLGYPEPQRQFFVAATRVF